MKGQYVTTVIRSCLTLQWAIICLAISGFVLAPFYSFSQKADSTNVLTSSAGPSDQFARDTTEVKAEVSPLDIMANRGLYIMTPNGKMQLRILGSVRFSVLYDNVDFSNKKNFNTYYIPTGSNHVKLPNFSSSLGQSRLGFEVNRKLEEKNVFIRLEMDFNGNNESFRIRHAYGQMGSFLVGQTWSLFSNVSSMPTMVDGNGPTGSVTLRTPQVRYSRTNNKGTHWAVAMEYSSPDLNSQEIESSRSTSVQLIPDFTGRIVREGIFGEVQLSTVITSISMKDTTNKVTSSFGIGGSLSGTIDLTKKHKVLYQVTYGRSISHFITTFNGTGTDAIYNPETGKLESLTSLGTFASYGWHWTDDITTNASGGYAHLQNKSYQSGDAFKNSMSLSLDSFWTIVEGARIGLEYVYGHRWDKDGNSGGASRVWALFYYDF